MKDSPITVDAARNHYPTIFAPWIQDLNITIEKFDEGEVVMKMPYDDRLCRIGGIVWTVADGFNRYMYGLRLFYGT